MREHDHSGSWFAGSGTTSTKLAGELRRFEFSRLRRNDVESMVSRSKSSRPSTASRALLAAAIAVGELLITTPGGDGYRPAFWRIACRSLNPEGFLAARIPAFMTSSRARAVSILATLTF